jgi:phosphotransferase system, mannose/fructose-specific component IIA
MWYYVHDDYDVYNERDDTDAEEMKEPQERSWMRMNRIILASHGGLSAGMKDTVQMILGELPNLYALATLRDETEPITVAARRLLDGFAAEDAVYIVTDVMGGSVNNEMLTLLPEYPAVHLICGMNASLVLTLASNDEALTQDELAECIADAKAQIIDCNLLLKNAAQDEEDDL